MMEINCRLLIDVVKRNIKRDGTGPFIWGLYADKTLTVKTQLNVTVTQMLQMARFTNMVHAL